MSRTTATLIVAVALWIALVVIGGATGLRAALPFDDKIHHAAAWGVLGALVAAAARHHWPRATPALVGMFAVALGLGFGALDEFVQSMVPGRDADLMDLAADSVGLIVGVALSLVVVRPGASRSSSAA